ncbi:LysR substrate-binding domain-containing protein [Cupriavidus nantongensis]|uniref:LysR substrate-binding domain-containing protein n=1 Tax=Cupriavidus nantongensis TaxID=1796606 RepID=UPI00358E7641
MTGERVASSRQIRSRLRIRHLELLLALGELRSLHKAGARLGMTQPAASKLLQEIEEMFGVHLFIRSARGIAPTEFGTALLRKAELLLSDLDSAREEIDSLVQGAAGRIRVGALQVALPALLPRAFAQLRSTYPRISFLLQEGASDVLLTALARGELDCVLGRVAPEIPPTELFSTEILYEEPVCVAARVGHPLADTDSVTPEVLARQEWILPARDAPLRHTIERYFREEGLAAPFAMIESVSVLANAILMRDTDLLAAMPLAVANHYAELNVLTILRFRPDWTLPQVGIVMRSNAPDSPVMTAFLSTLRAVAGELGRRDVFA